MEFGLPIHPAWMSITSGFAFAAFWFVNQLINQQRAADRRIFWMQQDIKALQAEIHDLKTKPQEFTP